MICLGLDSGFSAPGLAAVEFLTSPITLRESRVLAVNSVKTERAEGAKSRANDDARRVGEVVEAIELMVKATMPNLAIVELPSSGARGSIALKAMAMGSAAAITTLLLLRVPMVLITPHANKVAATGNRKAEKQAMIDAVSNIWPNVPWPRQQSKHRKHLPDVKKQEAIADALSAVVTYVSMVKSGKNIVLIEHGKENF